MSPQHPDAEDALERAAIDLLAALGWDTANGYAETWPGGPLGRTSSAEVVLFSRLISALEKLNPDLPREAIDIAVDSRSGTSRN